MAFNPFNEKPQNLDALFMDWEKIYPISYGKDDVDAYTKVRCVLCNGAEFEAVWSKHQFSRHEPNNDLRREIALLRKQEQQQQKRVACLKPLDETVLEHTLTYEQLAVDLTAFMGKRAKDEYFKKALDFALLEDFDHLYRYANLLNLEQGTPAEKLVGSYTEIMPARPTISQHRYPFDEIKRHINFKTAENITKLDVSIIVAAEQQTMNYYMNQGQFHSSDEGRKLYSEIAMIEEEHVTHYGSLIDTNQTYLECLLNHEYSECYLYYSMYKDETDKHIRKIWEEHLLTEIAHLHKAAELLENYEHKNWRQVIANGDFPDLISFAPQKDYVREVLKTTVGLTSDLENYRDVGDMDGGSNFFKYQKIVNSDVDAVPTHRVIKSHISARGADYRLTDSESPVSELRNRKKDNVSLGRTKAKVGV